MPKIYAPDSRAAQRLRRMYATGRGNRTATWLSHLWAHAFGLGLFPRRWVTLEVRGRRSGVPRRFPLGMVRADGHWYLVSMLGECAWVANVRAAGGDAILIRRGRHPVRLVEVPSPDRADILARYVEQVPGGRPHIPVPPGAPVAEFAAVAQRFPVFAIYGRPSPT